MITLRIPRSLFIIFLILFLGLALRLALSPLGFHDDIFSNAGWGEWIYFNGPKGFYDNTIWLYSWPTQPPFISLVYGFDRLLYQWLLELFRWMANTIVYWHLAPGKMIWFFNFLIWFDTGKINPVSAFQTGYLITIKLLPILADLGIAFVIYRVSKKILFPIIYLFSPFSIYLSSLWGQYDQVAFLPLLVAFVLIAQRRFFWLSPFLFALSIAIKPTGIIFIPLFVYLYFRSTVIASKAKQSLNINFFSLFISLITILAFFYYTTIAFTDKSLFEFLPTLHQKIFLKADMRLSTNAFNFWRIFIGKEAYPQTLPFLFIPAWVWGLAIYVGLHLVLLRSRIFKVIDLKSVCTSLFVVGAGSFLFLTNMLDRYFFAGIVSGLLVCIWYPKLLKYWFPLSLIFFLNLFNQWWFPKELNQLKLILEWNEAFVTRILSLFNVLLFSVLLIKGGALSSSPSKK